MVKSNATKNLEFGDRVIFRSGERGRHSEGVVLHRSPRKVLVYQPNYERIKKVSPDAIISLADEAKRTKK